MFYAARIVRNNHNWERPSGLAEYGVPVNGKNICSYNYGLEEWLNNKILKEYKWGYLDCYRSSVHLDVCDIMLFMICRNKDVSTIFHVGFICGVKQLNNAVIPVVRTALGASWLGNPIDQDFRQIEGNIPSVGMPVYRANNWLSRGIVAPSPTGFILNIIYDKLVFYKRENWVNLTQLDPDINKRWRRINKRYTVNDIVNDNIIKQALKEYLSKIEKDNSCRG